MDALQLDRWRDELRDKKPRDILRWAVDTFGADLAFATSLGAEDQVITHYVARHAPQIPVVFVDTGRLFQQSHDLLQETQDRFKLNIQTHFPDAEEVEDMVHNHGTNLFQRERGLRHLCCMVRKVRPLRKALAPFRAWISGLRQDQAPSRAGIQPIDWDEANGMWRIAPLWNWHEKELWDFIRLQRIPTNALHRQGYTNIGCAPCSRAIKPGEGWRDGRWWWENGEPGESGLHQPMPLEASESLSPS